MKKELEEKEAKYAEMDATVETANNISTSEEDDELKREGDGAYTDDEVSYENDPIAKQLSQSRRTAKQRREFARRERQRMAERVESQRNCILTMWRLLLMLPSWMERSSVQKASTRRVQGR